MAGLGALGVADGAGRGGHGVVHPARAGQLRDEPAQRPGVRVEGVGGRAGGVATGLGVGDEGRELGETPRPGLRAGTRPDVLGGGLGVPSAQGAQAEGAVGGDVDRAGRDTHGRQHPRDGLDRDLARVDRRQQRVERGAVGGGRSAHHEVADAQRPRAVGAVDGRGEQPRRLQRRLEAGALGVAEVVAEVDERGQPDPVGDVVVGAPGRPR